MSIMDDTEKKEEKVQRPQQSKQAAASPEKTTEVKPLKVVPAARKGDEGDAATDRESDTLEYQKAVLKRNLNHIKLPFPWKVQEMLANVEKEGKNDIVSWLPHGKSFRVNKEQEFVASIMPSYFNQSKFTSFTRQLYIYGFQKVQDGPDKGAFFHKQFIRSNKSLCLSMRRKKDKPLQKQPDPTSAFINSRNLLAAGQNRMMSINAPSARQLMQGQGQAQSFSSHGLANFLHNTNVALPSMGVTLPPVNSSLAAALPELQASASVPGFPNIQVPSRASSLTMQEQQAEEEDWLAKYERLTARHSPNLSNNAAASEQMHPTNVQSSQVGSPEVRQQDWLSIVQTTVPNLSSSSNAFSMPTPSVATNQNLLLESSLQGRQQQIQEQKIHPRLSSRSNREKPRHCQDNRASEPSKEAEVLSDGDEVDFEGMRFHFVERN